MLQYNCVLWKEVLKQGQNYNILTGELDYVCRALVSCIGDFTELSCVNCELRIHRFFICETLA